MPRDVARDNFYRAPINLWVEDETTRAYLQALWDDPAIALFIAGGNEGVAAAVKDAEAQGYPHVFGLIDRDFRSANKAKWSDDRGPRKFVTIRHEIENYLLDPEALAGCRYNTLRRTAEQVAEFMANHARRLCWWAACREVVAEFRERFRANFLNDPGPALDDETKARDHICQHPWFLKLDAEVAGLRIANVERLLTEAHGRASDQVVDGRWRDEFSGKEIFRDVGSRIFDRQHGPPARKGAAFDAELAKEVARVQIEQKTVPADLADLLDAMKIRVDRIGR